MSDGGKGSKQRPTDEKKWSEGYDRIFGKKPRTRDSRPLQGRRLRAPTDYPDGSQSYGGSS